MPESTPVSIQIAASPERVFAALVDPNELMGWFAECAEVDLASGRYDVWGRRTPGNPTRTEGVHRILRCVPARELTYSWPIEGLDAAVSIRLVPAGGGTVATLQFSCDEGVGVQSWGHLDVACLALQNLRSWVEDGVVAWLPDFAVPRSGELRISVDAACEPSSAYAALLNPVELERWMMANEPIIEARVGGRYELGWPEHEAHPLTILALEPDRTLTYSWSDSDAPGTVVTWELEGSGAATRITLIHSGFGADSEVDGYYRGWADMVVRLKWLLEKGPGWNGPLIG